MSTSSLQLYPGMRFIAKATASPVSLQPEIAMLTAIALGGCISVALMFAGIALVVLLMLKGTGLLASVILVSGLMLTAGFILCAVLYQFSEFKKTTVE